MPDDLWRASAGELASAIRRGEVSSIEVVESHLARVDAVNGHLNAVVRVLAGRSARRRAGRRRSGGCGAADLGPLHGVPISVKDNIAVGGTPTTSACPPTRKSTPRRTH